MVASLRAPWPEAREAPAARLTDGRRHRHGLEAASAWACASSAGQFVLWQFLLWRLPGAAGVRPWRTAVVAFAFHARGRRSGGTDGTPVVAACRTGSWSARHRTGAMAIGSGSSMVASWRPSTAISPASRAASAGHGRVPRRRDRLRRQHRTIDRRPSPFRTPGRRQAVNPITHPELKRASCAAPISSGSASSGRQPHRTQPRALPSAISVDD